MKRVFVFSFLLILSFTALTAQTKSIQKSPVLTEASPESVGISPERLARIDQMCEDAVAEGQVPGIISLIARDGKIVHWKAYGMAENEKKSQLKRDDIFRIASQTKAITSTAVMMLWEEGKFRLDDPVSKYIPEFKNPRVLNSFKYSDTTWTGIPANKEITIRHLLTHTSGIGYGIIDGDERMKMIYQKAGVTDLFTTENITIGESVKKLAKLPLHHHPGEKYTYSEGLDVLGYFIEVVSGMPFDEFLKTRIFDPLGMNDTRFYFPESKTDRLVAVQLKVNGEWKKYPVTFYDTDYPVKGAKTFFSGGAGLSSTAKDYATFLQMYLNGGEYNGVRLLSSTTVQTIMANQTGNLWGGDEKHYGLAFGVVTPEGQDKGGIGSRGTFDWGGYFNTQYFADPEENVIGIIMKQTQGPQTIRLAGNSDSWFFKPLMTNFLKMNKIKELAKMIDHSILHPTMTDEDLRRECEVAKKYDVASVCVKPYAVKQAVELLTGSDVLVGCVIGFPAGNSAIEVKVFETEVACNDGAVEIDMVINIGKALQGDWDYIEREIGEVTQKCHENGAIVKVIFETDYVTKKEDIVKLCKICTKVGADYVKTSSGFGFVKDDDGKYTYQGATIPNLKLMKENVGPHVKVKAAGGVRTLDGLIAVKEAGCTRCGATATVKILEDAKKRFE